MCHAGEPFGRMLFNSTNMPVNLDCWLLMVMLWTSQLTFLFQRLGLFLFNPSTPTYTLMCSQIYFIIYSQRNSQSCNLCFLDLGTHQNHLLLSCVLGDSGLVGLERAWKYSFKAPYMILMTARVENHPFRPVSNDLIIQLGKLQVFLQRVLQILKCKG